MGSLTHKILTLLIVLVVLSFGALSLWTRYAHRDEESAGTVCAQDVQMCPDGSYVGRTGESCTFALCPASSATVEAGVGQRVSALEVSLTPLRVLEDSRCPVDVQCIQAGTVRVSVLLESGLGTAPQTFTLGKPITTEAETITLTSVSPLPRASVSIDPSSYRFTFTLAEKKSENVYHMTGTPLSFRYSSLYFATESTAGTGDTLRRDVILLPDTAENHRVVEGKDEGREFPPAISVTLFPHTTLPLPLWIQQKRESNFHLALPGTTLSPTKVMGLDALSYSWDGLYQGESVAFLYKGQPVIFSVTSMTPESRIRTDFRDVLSSLTATPL